MFTMVVSYTVGKSMERRFQQVKKKLKIWLASPTSCSTQKISPGPKNEHGCLLNSMMQDSLLLVLLHNSLHLIKMYAYSNVTIRELFLIIKFNLFISILILNATDSRNQICCITSTGKMKKSLWMNWKMMTLTLFELYAVYI